MNKARRRDAARNRIIGSSPEIQEVWRAVETFAPSGITILLQGESGTGKELFARAIHEISGRSEGPFVPVDCASLPETLLEAELFGYEKGAFTGAETSKPGKFLLADHGTVFLDEVGNIPLAYQPKLLRVLQENRIWPIGTKSAEGIRLDIRVIASSNVNLKKRVHEGMFREDLFFRLNAATIELPPLSARTGDVKLLAQYFANLYSGIYWPRRDGAVPAIAPEALEALEGYVWPGNVRELENVMKRACLLADGTVGVEHLPKTVSMSYSEIADQVFERVVAGSLEGVGLKKLARLAREEYERNVITKALGIRRFTKAALARFLGIDPKTLRAKLKAFGLTEERI